MKRSLLLGLVGSLVVIALAVAAVFFGKNWGRANHGRIVQTGTFNELSTTPGRFMESFEEQV